MSDSQLLLLALFDVLFSTICLFSFFVFSPFLLGPALLLRPVLQTYTWLSFARCQVKLSMDLEFGRSLVKKCVFWRRAAAVAAPEGKI